MIAAFDLLLGFVPITLNIPPAWRSRCTTVLHDNADGSSIHSKRGSGMELDSHYSNPAHSPPEDDWSTVTDPNERRKIQNRNAQRKFREKQKQQREESERTQENQQRAADAYTSPDPDDVAEVGEMSGLPWGGMSLRHIIETGRTKEQSSRESSLNAKISQSGGSSR
nr:apicidin f cluster transcription factor apf2 [Quercus suber]